jgi:hypothetical protein
MKVKKNSIFTENEMKSKYKFEISAKLQWKWNFYLWKWNESETIFYTFSITIAQTFCNRGVTARGLNGRI